MKPNTRNSFLFLRHGETDHNRLGIRCGGEIDVPLNSAGLAQAETIGRQLRLADLSLRWIVAGTLKRVQQTAEIVAAHLDLDIESTASLNERRLGEWNGRLISETQEALSAGITPPGGETAAEFRVRVIDWLEEWRPRLAEPGLIVASKGIGRVLSEVLTGSNVTAGNCEVLLFESGESGNYRAFSLEQSKP